MNGRAVAVTAIIVFATAYVFLFQDPLFSANSNATTAFVGQVILTPALPDSPPTPWNTAGLAYSCGTSGPGIIQLTYHGTSSFAVVSMTLSYGGSTYSASGPSCPVAPDTTVISIVALGAAPPAQGTSFSGYLVASDGSQLQFSGTWS